MKFGPPLVGLPHSRKPQFIHLLVGKNAGELGTSWWLFARRRRPDIAAQQNGSRGRIVD